MSMGNLDVVGNYHDQMITIQVTDLPVPSEPKNLVDASTNVINEMNARYAASGSLNLSDGPRNDFSSFDNFTTGACLNKLNTNSHIDVLFIIWRNHVGIGDGLCAKGSVGGVSSSSTTFLGQNGVSLVGKFVACSFFNLTGIFTHELNHPFIGDNNSHIGSGAGQWALPGVAHCHGMLTSGSTNLCNGWDRLHLGWHGYDNLSLETRKHFLISAKSVSDTELHSDFSNFSSLPASVTLRLRDFVKTGDVLRIKLPHFNHQPPYNLYPKNQYIWIANHQNLSEFDSTVFDCSPWDQGLQAYIQVGKDIHYDSSDAYVVIGNESLVQTPNALGNFMYKLSFEGNFDDNILLDDVQSIVGVDDCLFPGLQTAPVDQLNSLPNAFTGNSDLFRIPNTTNADVLDGVPRLTYSDFNVNFTKVKTAPGPSLNWKPFDFGDAEDVFSRMPGSSFPVDILSVATNPAPVPILTLRSKFSTGDRFPPPYSSSVPLWENRKIFLNGIRVQLMNVIPNSEVGGNDYEVKITFNDYKVRDDVRWCGDIVLKNDGAFLPNMKILGGNTVLLDRGTAPTFHIATLEPTDGQYYFTTRTRLAVQGGATLTTEPNSRSDIKKASSLQIDDGIVVNQGEIHVYDHSEFTVEAQGLAQLEDFSRVFIHSGGTMSIKADGELLMPSKALIVVEDGGTLRFESGSIVTIGPQSKIRIEGGGTLVSNGITIEFPGPGIGGIDVLPFGTIATESNHDFRMNGRGCLHYYKDAVIAVNGTGKFILTGVSKNSPMLGLYQDAVLRFVQTEVNLTDLTVLYWSDSRLVLEQNRTSITGVLFKEHVGATALPLLMINNTVATLDRVTIKNFGTHFSVEDFSAAPGNSMVFEDCLFENARDVGVALFDCAGPILFDHTQINAAANTVWGLEAHNCLDITLAYCLIDEFDGTVTPSTPSGVYADRVGRLELLATQVTQNTIGIYAHQSNIKVNNGSIIDENTVGIEAYDYPVSGGSGTGAYTVSVGESGCGWIINNGEGIIGESVILDIDALQHAMDRGDPDDVHPNRFDGNGAAFDVCYYNNLPAATTVYAQGNYWGDNGLGNYSYLGNYLSNEITTYLASCKGPVTVQDFFFQTSLPLNCECPDCTGRKANPNNPGNEHSFNVFPNPTTGWCTVESSMTFDKVELFNAKGQLLQRLEHLDTGSYPVLINTDSEELVHILVTFQGGHRALQQVTVIK
ncbi:MAG: hypothetical protein GC205_12095 [Bacteroidetes bacterium]|nr:hypothetical protein [Bacteroidota bacterium]